jgi:hypothetical protein
MPIRSGAAQRSFGLTEYVRVDVAPEVRGGRITVKEDCCP